MPFGLSLYTLDDERVVVSCVLHVRSVGGRCVCSFARRYVHGDTVTDCV